MSSGSSTNCESSQDGDAPSCFDTSTGCCLRNTCGQPDNRPPFAKTNPEGRRYGVVIINKNGEKVDATVILEHIWELFLNCTIPDLKFSPCVPMAEFDGNMLIVTGNENTAQWLISAVETITPPHEAVTFIKYFNLMRCSVILPYLTPNEWMCSIFEFFEVQNEGIVTDKWVSVGRNNIDSSMTVDIANVQQVFGNELVVLYLDAESKELITKQCSQLKFVYWTVKFKFDDDSGCKEEV